MGGGRRGFLPNTTVDPEDPDDNGEREDGRDLTQVCKGSGPCVIVNRFKQVNSSIMDRTKSQNMVRHENDVLTGSTTEADCFSRREKIVDEMRLRA